MTLSSCHYTVFYWVFSLFFGPLGQPHIFFKHFAALGQSGFRVLRAVGAAVYEKTGIRLLYGTVSVLVLAFSANA